MQTLNTSKERERKYEVKIFFPEDEIKLRNDHRDQISSSHCGLFSHNGKKLRVEIRSHVLASLKLSRDEKYCDEQSKLFDAVWEAASPLDKSIIEKVVGTVKPLEKVQIPIDPDRSSGAKPMSVPRPHH